MGFSSWRVGPVWRGEGPAAFEGVAQVLPEDHPGAVAAEAVGHQFSGRDGAADGAPVAVQELGDGPEGEDVGLPVEHGVEVGHGRDLTAPPDQEATEAVEPVL